jgi:2-polyprenyl-3-methyl-5-hydroxy-6-metoxy-1,4-benzoquinol methylase
MPMTRVDRLELLDTAAEHVPARELAGNLRDIRRANRYFGGTRAVLRTVRPLLRDWPDAEPLALLDVATGSADIPAALLGVAQRAGVHADIVATDAQPGVLAIARAAERPGQLRIEQADARALPYPDAAFDVVTLSLALHHFAPEEGLQVLSEMRRVGRRLLIVNDLERCRSGYLGAWLVGRLLTRNRLTRHDAPLSVQRAYTRAEALALARAAGWRQTHARGAAPFRYVLTGAP